MQMFQLDYMMTKSFLCMGSLVWSLLMEKITLKFWPEWRRKGLNSKMENWIYACFCQVFCQAWHAVATIKNLVWKVPLFLLAVLVEIICSAEVLASCSCCWWQPYLRSLRWHILQKMLFHVLSWTSRIIACFRYFFCGFVLLGVFFLSCRTKLFFQFSPFVLVWQ